MNNWAADIWTQAPAFPYWLAISAAVGFLQPRAGFAMLSGSVLAWLVFK